MLGSDYLYNSPQKLRKEIYKLNYNLKRRTERIEKKYGSDIAAVRKYKEIQIPKYLSKVEDIKDLRRLYRDLSYINDLKTSSVKGVQNYLAYSNDIIGKVKNIWSDFDEDDKRKYYQVLSRMEEYFGGIYERYKYEVMDVLVDVMKKEDNRDINEITNTFIETYLQTDYENYLKEREGQGYDAKEFRIQYSKRLRDIFK